MKIDRQNERSLLIALTEAIQGASVRSWPWVSFPNNWEDAAQQSLDESFRKTLYKHLDNGGLESVARDYILRRILSSGISLPSGTEADKYPTKSVTSYAEFSDPLALSREIIDYLKGGPHDYVVFVQAFRGSNLDFLPDDLDLKISERLTLLSGSKILNKVHLSTGIVPYDEYLWRLNLNQYKSIKIDKNVYYFEYRTSGFLTDRSRPSCLNDMADDIRACYGASLAFELLNYISFFRESKSVILIANSIRDGSREFAYGEVAEEDINDVTQSFFNSEVLKRFENGERFENIFAPVLKLFNSSESQRLKTSAIWLLRAFLTERGMDRILDSTISIEVLLGDRDASDRVGLSKLMANRCAYALGKSAKERLELYNFFMEFYKLRSEIVHSGRLKISESEAALVDRGVKLASRIILHEVEMN